MTKYFVISDVHGFYNEMVAALDAAGYDSTNPNHTLISCGDNFDRGPDNEKVMQFLLRQPNVVLLRGNHEDLFDEACLKGISMRDYMNGTVDTIIQFGNNSHKLDWTVDDMLLRAYKHTKILFDKMVDYYETDNYVFVHGWLPDVKNWRNADIFAWRRARWYNGMEKALHGCYEPSGKTVVCGHWHTSWGHSRINNTSEWGEDADFSIYRNKGIIAIDGCTAYTGKVNVLVIED